MIRGVVRPSRTDGSGLEAWIEISVIGDDGAYRPLEVVVDTGFTGWLTVPPSSTPLIGVNPSGKRYGTLANGQVEDPISAMRLCYGMITPWMCGAISWKMCR